MTYLTQIADAIRSEVDATAIPEGDVDALFLVYAVLALAKGVHVTSEDVHNAWAAWMSQRDPNHPSIRPFADLSAETQLADAPYLAAIRRVASQGAGTAMEP